MTRSLHISSLVVRCCPERLGQVTSAIQAIPNTEIAIADPSGRIVVTMATTGEAEIADALTRMQLFHGVANAALVFHQIDEGPETGPKQGAMS